MIKIKNQTGSIYIIKNKVNDKVYIGQTTTTVHERFMQHKKPCTRKKRGSYKLYNAMNKYGVDNFYIETLETDVPIDKLDAAEIAYIEQYDSCNNGYNTTYGGNVRRIYKPRDIEHIKSLFEQGYKAKEIADMYGVCSATIMRTIHGSGYYVHDQLDKEKLQELVNQGLTNQQIADKLGSKEWTIVRRLHDYGIRRRKIYLKDRTNFNYDAFYNDVNEGLSIKRLANKYDINEKAVSKLKNEYLNNQ